MLLWFSRKAADTGSLLTHFICYRYRSIIYEAKGEELYNSHVERLLAEYLIDTLPVEFLPPPACVRSIVSLEAWPLWRVIYFDWLVLSARLLVYYVCCHLVARWGYYSLYIFGPVPLWLCEDITACYMYCFFRNNAWLFSGQLSYLIAGFNLFSIHKCFFTSKVLLKFSPLTVKLNLLFKVLLSVHGIGK